MTTMYLVRHGETEWNRTNRYQGWTDVALSEKGKDQARRMGERLGELELDAVYASDLGRATETAQGIVGGRKLPFFLHSGLREMNFGVMEGLTRQEIAEAYPQVWRDYQDDSLNTVVQGGESYRQVLERVRLAVEEIGKEYANGKVALVGHGGSLRAVLINALGLDPRERWRLRLANASISILLWTGGSGELALFNDTGHLSEAALGGLI